MGIGIVGANLFFFVIGPFLLLLSRGLFFSSSYFSSLNLEIRMRSLPTGLGHREAERDPETGKGTEKGTEYIRGVPPNYNKEN